MKPRILIGYDGSECANAAIDDLTKAGLPPEAEAVVMAAADVEAEEALSVCNPSADMALVPQSPAVVLEARAQVAEATSWVHATAMAGAGRVGGLFPGWAVTAGSVAG